MDPVLKILHLEDNPVDAYLVERELKKAGLRFQLRLAETEKDFKDALMNYKPDLILSDHSMPQFDSMEALKIFNEYKGEVPFILITGSVSEEFAIRSIKEGADDYILKNNLIRLPSAIAQALKSRKAESEKRKSDAELEAINKELNTFIYKAAHDLRGPLCSIMGLINVAGFQKDATVLPDYLNKISESTHKLDSILLSLMEIMSIKNITPVIKEVDFKLLIANILERLKTSDGFSNIEFKIDVKNDGGFFSDENILNAVLYNIIENAIKFSNRGNVRSYVQICVKQIETGIQIQVEDNGIGMGKDVQEKIFEMYYKGSQSSKTTGLGLYVALNGARKLGGTIEVASTPGTGSVFTILVPGNLVYLS